EEFITYCIINTNYITQNNKLLLYFTKHLFLMQSMLGYNLIQVSIKYGVQLKLETLYNVFYR
ncbi:MAG: hypothetical protein PHC56_08060, partial [Herbinix sp.]|nr:hypothetical protein [Herbinix sp.]